MLPDAERFRLLHGPYQAPKCRVGRLLRCTIRGELRVVGISAGRIPWPLVALDMDNGGTGRPFLAVCGDLEQAIRREAAQAVAYWWGVNVHTVSAWRRALNVAAGTEGTRKLHATWWHQGGVKEASLPALLDSIHSPERIEKVAASKRGKPPPAHVIEAARQARIGMKHTDEARAKMSAAHQARRTYPPAAGRPFTPEEDDLLGTAMDREIAERLDRDRKTVTRRRRRLGIPSYASKVGRGRTRRDGPEGR